jgi:hypothetical protein
MISLFRPLESGEQIVIGADPAEGGDNSVFVAISKVYTDVVMVGVSKEESSQLGYTLNHVGKFIQTQTNLFPIIAVERNTGNSTLFVLKQNNYPALYKMPKTFTGVHDEDQEQYGWVTNMATRPKMLDDLALAIRQEAIKIPSKEIVDELFTFIRHIKTGKPQADVGCHDDLVIALAIAWQVYQTQTPIYEAENQMYFGGNYYDINSKAKMKWQRRGLE